MTTTTTTIMEMTWMILHREMIEVIKNFGQRSLYVNVLFGFILNLLIINKSQFCILEY